MVLKLCKLVLICTALCTVLALNLAVASPARADEHLDLVIDGGVIVPWNISNIMPGSSGVVNVDVSNAGDISGYLAVWIDGITDTEGENPPSETGNTGEPGELSQYLTLNISGQHISPYTASPYFELPVVLNQFPQSSAYPLQLSDQPLEAGETIQIQWEWVIPPQTTNVIQGDRVSFDIHYTLTENLLVPKPSPPTGGGSFGPEKPASPDTEADEQKTSETQTGAFSDNKTGTRKYYSPDGKLTIIVPQETRVISAEDEELSYIIITFSPYPPSIPRNSVLLSPIYDVTTFTVGGSYEYVELDGQVIIVIEFDNDKLPEGFSFIYAACYDADSGWVKLTDVLEINRGEGRLIILTTRLSTVAVFAEPAAAGDSREAAVSPGEGPVTGSPDSGIPQDIRDTSAAKSRLMWDILSRASLAVASIGALAMAILAYIERKRRDKRRKPVRTLNARY